MTINQVLYHNFCESLFIVFPPELPLLIQLGDEIAGIGPIATTATTLGPTAAQFDLISGSPPPASIPTTNLTLPLDTGTHNHCSMFHNITISQVAQCNHRI